MKIFLVFSRIGINKINVLWWQATLAATNGNSVYARAFFNHVYTFVCAILSMVASVHIFRPSDAHTRDNRKEKLDNHALERISKMRNDCVGR